MTVILTSEEEARVNDLVGNAQEEQDNFQRTTEQVTAARDQTQLDEDIFVKFRDDAVVQINALLDQEVLDQDTASPALVPHTKELLAAFPPAGVDPRDWEIRGTINGTATTVTPLSPTPADSEIDDTGLSLSAGAHVGQTFKITSGALSGSTFVINANTATKITVTGDVTGMIIGDTFQVLLAVVVLTPPLTPGSEPNDSLINFQDRFDLFSDLVINPTFGTTARVDALTTAVSDLEAAGARATDRNNEFIEDGFPTS